MAEIRKALPCFNIKSKIVLIVFYLRRSLLELLFCLYIDTPYYCGSFFEPTYWTCLRKPTCRMHGIVKKRNEKIFQVQAFCEEKDLTLSLGVFWYAEFKN